MLPNESSLLWEGTEEQYLRTSGGRKRVFVASEDVVRAANKAIFKVVVKC